MSNEENNKLEALKCDQCGGNLAKSYRVEYDEDDEEDVSIPIAKCTSCGKEFDQQTNEYYVLFADDLTYDKDNSVFKLGLKGTLHGVEYEIIGRIRYQEEDEYEKSTWDEWVAISEDGVYHYFVEEDGEAHSFEEYTPDSIDLEENPRYIEFDGKKISKEDAYVGRIVLAEGELPWEPEIGEPVRIYDFKKDGHKYSIEHAEDEVTITKGDEIDYQEIFDAFGNEEQKQLFESTMKKRSSFAWMSRIYLIFFILTFIVSIFQCGNSDRIKGVMKGRKVISSNIYQRDKTGYYFMSQVLFGPFKLDSSNALYEIDVKVNERVQRLHLEWQSFRMMIIEKSRFQKVLQGKKIGKTEKKKTDVKKEKKKEKKKTKTSKKSLWGSSGSDTEVNETDRDLHYGGYGQHRSLKKIFDGIDTNKDVLESFQLSGNFWDERGYDSDGAWHENDLKASTDFKLDKKGWYYAYVELYNQKRRSPLAIKYSITRVRSYRFFTFAFIIFFILFLVYRAKSKAYNELPFDIS